LAEATDNGGRVSTGPVAYGDPVGFRHLLRRADSGSLQRGTRYAERGLVEILPSARNEVVAVVRGSNEYDVALDAGGGTCTCPVGLRGQFCKHLVATVLTVEDDVRPMAPASQEPSRIAAPPADLAALARSLRVRSHLAYWRANDHGDRAHEVADEFEVALTDRSADELRPLLELAIDAMTKAIIKSDDSSGIQSQALGRFFDVHASASRLGSPDPRKLARWMAKVHFHDYGFTYVDPGDYAEALGEPGLTAFVKEVDRRAATDPDDWSVRWARQRLAVLARDIPAIVETVGGPLSGAHDYGSLVDALLEIGAEDEALRYALEGLDAQPIEHQTVPLYDVATRLLGQRGEHDEVVRLRRRQLSAFPTASSYAALRRAAQPAGHWSSERLDALDVLLEHNPRDYVVTLLREGEVDLAWGVSRTMALDANLRVQLLQARSKTQPADVFEGYVALIEDTLKVADQQRYTQAVAYLRDLRRAAGAAGLQRQYAEFVDGLLETHRWRSKLIAMLIRMPAT
jgi:uncharacterized Zn finger protein